MLNCVPRTFASKNGEEKSVGSAFATYLAMDRATNAKHPLDGNYRVTWSMQVANLGQAGQVRLFDAKASAVLDGPYTLHGARLEAPVLISHTVVLRHESAQGRIFQLQYRDETGENEQRADLARLDVQRV